MGIKYNSHRERPPPIDSLCNEYAAMTLAKRIRDYWAGRGLTVHVRVEKSIAKVAASEARPRMIWLIRSDLLNGWPRSTAAQKRVAEPVEV